MEDDLLLRYLQKECSADDYERVLRWLDEDPNHQRELYRMEQLFHSGVQLRASRASEIRRAEARLTSRLKSKPLSRATRLQRFRPYLAYAASIAAVVLVSFLLYCFVDAKSGGDYITMSVSVDEPVRELYLPDGSKVWLNKQSQIRYLKDFDGDTREVDLEGEAYFEVAKDGRRPFIVSTDAMRVKVLGTMFNVKSFRGSDLVEASLIEGSVQVLGRNDEGMILLTPGQKAMLNRTRGTLQVRPVDAKLEVVWHDNLIPFEQATLFDIVDVLERFYDVKIILSPNINYNSYSGVIPYQPTVDLVLQSLKNVIPIDYKIQGNRVYISQLN